MRSVASNNLKKKTEEAVKAVLLRQLEDENVECNELLDEMGEQVTVLDDSNSIISQYEEILKKKKRRFAEINFCKSNNFPFSKNLFSRIGFLEIFRGN